MEPIIYVYLLTNEQAALLVGQLWDDVQYFNPVKDGLDRWIISSQEVDGCINPNTMWVKDLTAVEYVRPIEEEY